MAPYVGFGWGNTVDKGGRITFLFDVGAIYGGTPEVKLTAECGSAVSVGRCNQLQDAVTQEERELEEDGAVAEWWPVLSLGFAVRF